MSLKLTGVITTTVPDEDFDKLFGIQDEDSEYCEYCGSLIDDDFGCEECEEG